MSPKKSLENNILEILSKKEMQGHRVKAITSSEQTKSSNLSMQELFEVSQNISRYYAPKVSNMMNKLVLLSVDPQHLYSYWSLDERQEKTMPLINDNNDWVLRIYPQDDREKKIKSKPLIEYKIHHSQSKQIIDLPVSKKSTNYYAKIGKLLDKGFISIVESNNTNNFKQKDRLVVDSLDDSINAFEPEIEGALYYNDKSENAHFVQTNYSGIG